MASPSYNAATATASLSQKVNRMIDGGSTDYNSWRSLILEIETASPEDIDTISLAYDSFLSTFPLCHWHLEKYAYHKAKLCGAQEAIKIYERGAGIAMFSVGFWVDYLTFGMACFEDPEDVRGLIGRAISFVGKDFFCHVLWDKYMKYEFNQEGWNFLALSYIQVLRFPTKKLHFYYDNFKQFVANLQEEMGYETNNGMEADQIPVPCAATEISRDEIALIIKDLLDSSDRYLKSKALDRYRAIGEDFYQRACQMEEKIKCFEKKIQKRYFFVTPLDDDQLNIWHLYLDFIDKLDDLDWAVKLYERCLISCANYPEFWMRYVEFLESKGGRELAISALDRAAQVFLKNVPEIHLFSARFKEHLGDVSGARTALLLCDTKTDSSFIESTVTLANLERRLGNFAAASATYEKALKTARERRRLHVLPTLYAQFAQLTFLISGSTAAARDVLIEGVRRVPHCRFLLEELIKFAMTHEGASHLNIIDSIIADAISPGLDEYQGLNAKDQENISCLFLEFVNLCGTIDDMRKAWNRHIELFPQFLRVRTTHKQSTSSNYLLDGVRNRTVNFDPAVQPSRNQCSGHRTQLQGQEQALEFPGNDEVHQNQVSGKLSPPKDHNIKTKERVQEQSSKAVIVPDWNASWIDEPAYESLRQSREDKLGRIIFSAESTDKYKENALNVCKTDQDLPRTSTEDKPGQMDASTELAKQSKENAMTTNKTVQEVGKSSVTTDSVEASPEVCHELDRDRSVSRQQNTPTKIHADPKEPSSTGQDSIEVEVHRVPATGHATSGIHKHVPDQAFKSKQNFYHDYDPANATDSKMDMNLDNSQQNPAKGTCSQVQLGVSVQADRATNQSQTASVTTPPTNMSAGQAPASSPSVSYSIQNASQITSQSGQHPWQTQQSLAMNQMLQYHYHQQQLLQQQYQQQQLHMQHPYLQLQHQYMNQQFYQLQPQQHNQQHAQLMNQQQLQSPPCQLQQQLPFFQQSQQQLQQQHYWQNQQTVGQMQSQQGQDPHPNFQQTNEKQHHQNQDVAYQAHQLAYQHVTPAQQQLLQQYQQYQGCQHMQQQRQSQEGPNPMQEHVHEHPAQKQQDQQHHQVNSMKLMQPTSQNQQGSGSTPPDGAAGHSESPLLRIRSP